MTFDVSLCARSSDTCAVSLLPYSHDLCTVTCFAFRLIVVHSLNPRASYRRYPTSPASGPYAEDRDDSLPIYLWLEAALASRYAARQIWHPQAALAARQCPCLASTFAPERPDSCL